MAKKTQLQSLMFPSDMYNNVYGSVIVCGYIFSSNEEKPSCSEIVSRWKTTVKKKGKGITWGIDDKDFIDKTLEYFGMKRPINFPIAFIQSSTNCLFAPYLDGKVYPLREDGFMGHTLSTGKVYPVEFDSEESTDD